jgi:hypothetical protein
MSSYNQTFTFSLRAYPKSIIGSQYFSVLYQKVAFLKGKKEILQVPNEKSKQDPDEE